MVRKRACDLCYRRKIQCSSLHADYPCEWCGQHGLDCTFTRDTRPNKKRNRQGHGLPNFSERCSALTNSHRVKPSDVQHLLSRVQELESALAQSPQLAIKDPPSAEALASPTANTLAFPTPDQDSPSGFRPPGSPNTPSSSLVIASNSFLSSQADPSRNIPPCEQNPFAGSHLGQNWYCRGIPILSEKGQEWISSKTGEDVAFGRFQLFRRQSALPPSTLQLDTSRQELWELPPRQVAQKVIDAFFKSSLQLVFPVLDRVLFEETIDTAYQQVDGIPSSRPQALARACVLATLLVAHRLQASREAIRHMERGKWVSKAQVLLGLVTEEASLVGVQTVLMLQKYRTITGHMQRATLLHAVACRMVCALGGHTHQSPRPREPEVSRTERHHHHIRQLFWLCYISDKDISLRSGQPPLLTEDYCDLTPPHNDWNYRTSLDGLDAILACDELPRHIPCDPQLCYLKEKIYRLLFSSPAYHVTDGVLLLRIRQLDDELEHWRLSIPADFRPQLSIPPNFLLPTIETSMIHNLRCIHLQLEYHYLITVIHTTVRRCGADRIEAGSVPEDLHTVIHSSYDLSLEASRSTLNFLKAALRSLVEDEFRLVVKNIAPIHIEKIPGLALQCLEYRGVSNWIHSHNVFYAIVAIMPLFIDILIHPQQPQSKAALELLVSAIGVIQGIPMCTPTQCDIIHMKEITEFVVELIHLGRCAIAKARMQQENQQYG